MRIHLRHKQHHIAVDLHAEGQHYRVAVEGAEHVVEARPLDDATLVLVLDGVQHRVDVGRAGRHHYVAVGGEVYSFVAESGAPSAHAVANIAVPEITAPMPGKILQVLVRGGDRVNAGDGLVILEAMKMENRMVAEAPATVTEVRVAEGDMVEGGQVLVVLAYEESASSD